MSFLYTYINLIILVFFLNCHNKNCNSVGYNCPSTNMYLSLNIVQYFLHSKFCVIQPTNCRVTNVLWVWEVKEHYKEHIKRMNNSLLQFFWKNVFRLLSSFSRISSSFFFRFEWFKTWWVHHLRFYKSSLYSGGKDATIQNFKLKILICFNSPITRYWTSFHQTPPYFPHSFMELKNLCRVGSARWRVTNGLCNLEVEEQCLRIQPPLSF